MKKIGLPILIALFCATASIFSQTVTTISAGTPDDAIAMDSNGNIYCSNYVGDTVFKFTPTGDMSAFITGLNTPNGLAFNSNQELYVCDGQGNTIYKYDIAGNQLASYPVTGHPSGVVKSFEDDSMIFTLYSGNGIRKLDTDGTITNVSSAPELSGPVGLVYDETGTLFVGNFNNRVIYKVLGTGNLEYVAQLPAEGGPYPNLGFITYGQGKLWGTIMGNDKIYSVNPNGIDDFTLFAGSTQGNNDGDISTATFNTPNGIYFNEADGSMYLTDFGSKNLRIISGITLGFEDNTDSVFDLKAYPNPAKDTLYIEGTNLNQELFKLRLADASGKMVFEREGNLDGTNFLEPIDVSMLSSGVYLVEMIIGKNVVTKKFIK
jgi:sugar lactone lactonase YvrE